MTFVLGKASEANLLGVQPKLICCVRYAIKRTRVDFSVFEGLRDAARQAKLYASGASRTLKSDHLDGYAVDLVPYLDGRLQWQQPLCIEVARVMHQASRDLSVSLGWGAVWDRELATLDADNLDDEIEAYKRRYRLTHPDPKKKALIDCPHFWLVRGQSAKEAA
jgi:peptidoglycan L-alanyl-D-glutamate endopeptidase CwlK